MTPTTQLNPDPSPLTIGALDLVQALSARLPPLWIVRPLDIKPDQPLDDQAVARRIQRRTITHLIAQLKELRDDLDQ